MADLVYLLPTVTGTILFPKLSAMTNDREKWEYVKKITTLMGGVMIVICSLGALFVKPLVLLLFGRPFLPAVPAFIWLMPGIVFWANSSFPLLYLQSTGMPRQVIYIWLLLISMNVTLNLLFLERWGIAGAAAISSITYLMSFFMFGAYAHKQSHG
jgi:O-antigen/teichoic acid export membrane protein